MGFQGSRLVFHGSRSVFIVFNFPGWFFMVPGGFLWLFKVPGRFFMIPGWFLWVFMVPGWFLSELSARDAK